MGDVTDRLNLTPVATAEGHALADTLFGKNPRDISLHNVPTAVFSTPPIATCGLTEEQAAEHGPVDVYVTKFTPMRHTLTGRARKSMMKLVVDQASQKVVGAHMLGEDAPEIMQGLAHCHRDGRHQGGLRPHHRHPSDRGRGVRHAADADPRGGRSGEGSGIAYPASVNKLPRKRQ